MRAESLGVKSITVAPPITLDEVSLIMPLIVTRAGFCAKAATQKNIKNRKMETLRMVIEFGKMRYKKQLKLRRIS